MPISDRDFTAIRNLVFARSGISLKDSKKSLVETRLGKRLRQLGLETFEQYVAHLADDQAGDEIVQMLNMISTNVTHFFREQNHFTFLAQAIATRADQGVKRLRIWCAAASTGEEPYTIAMTVRSVLDARRDAMDVRILGTDISTRVLDAAMAGFYAEEKLKPVDPSLLAKYFTRDEQGGQRGYRVNPSLRDMVLFRRLNLAEPPFPMKGPIDMVFCRNVMIYFEDETRQTLLQEIYKLLRPGGNLFVGHAESLTGRLIGEYRRVGNAVYEKPMDVALASPSRSESHS